MMQRFRASDLGNPWVLQRSMEERYLRNLKQIHTRAVRNMCVNQVKTHTATLRSVLIVAEKPKPSMCTLLPLPGENLKSKVENRTLLCKIYCWFHCFPVSITWKPLNESAFFECFPFTDFLLIFFKFFSSFRSFPQFLWAKYWSFLYFWKNSNIPCFLYIFQSPDFVSSPSLFYFFFKLLSLTAESE